MSVSPLRGALTAGLAALSLAVAAPAASAATGPANAAFASAFAVSQLNPDLDPPGANDRSCRPSAAHPRPVVLVHGTYENRYDNWASLSPKLRAAGYCVFALDYGVDRSSLSAQLPALKGTGDIPTSAKELARFVDGVRASTGAAKVDVVGHSQGGVMARQYLRFEGGSSKVSRLVTLGATNHGTTLGGVAALARDVGVLGSAEPVLGRGAIQQVQGSDFLRTLNAGGDTVPGVDYTAIASRYDEVTTPYRSTFLQAGPGATVRNITIQDGCPVDADDHFSLSYSPRVQAYVLRALGSQVPVPCVPRVPLF